MARTLLNGPRIGQVFAGPPSPARIAAAGTVAVAPSAGRGPAGWRWGRGMERLAEFTPPPMPYLDRAAAMSIPAISRARDLICAAVGALPIIRLALDPSSPDPVGDRQPPYTWQDRPDPNRTRQWILAWTTDDLLFYGEAHWRVTARFESATRYPAAFCRLEPGEVQVAEDGTIRINGTKVAPADVVQFLSPIEGVLSVGWRAISIALSLDDSAERFAGMEIPAGILEEQQGGEDLSADDLTKLTEQFNESRHTNVTAGTNKYVKYRETTSDPERLQLVQARGYQALESARLTNVPPYLVGAPTGTGMTYQNAETARSDLIDFGALPYIGCIEQTLSGPNVTPRTTVVRLDTDAWLRNPLQSGPARSDSAPGPAGPPPPAVTEPEGP